MLKISRRSIKKFFRRHFISVLVVVVVLLGAAGVLAWTNQDILSGLFSKNNSISQAPASAPAEQKHRRLLDGVFVSLAAPANPPLVGVMLENMEEAQPLSGLNKANLVFEAVTEANITRFLAFFALDDLANDKAVIGPVRSARPYYLDWVSELKSLYAHVGNSPEANRLIKQGVVRDLDQWFKSRYFWRETSRSAPHNVYTTLELFKKAVVGEKFVQNDFIPWQFKDDAVPEARGETAAIKVNYNSPYEVRWEYNKENNDYTRRQWGGEHKMSGGALVKAKNIAVAWEPMKVLDSVGRKWFGTIGEGKAVVFFDGQAIEGTWSKPAQDERMKFFNADNKEIEFNAGLTWVEIVPVGYGVEW
ncbi:MAG: DUF3048 domain-containing protein [bacterium]|nr:DUF3048 domain-containing protein [bacterium]